MNFKGVVKACRKLFLAEVLCVMAVIAETAALLYLTLNNFSVAAAGEMFRESAETAEQLIPFAVFSAGGLLLFLAAFIVTLAGLARGAHDERNFRCALGVELLMIGLTAAVYVIGRSNPQAARWLNVLTTVAQLSVSLLVVIGIKRAADSLGRKDVSELSDRTQKRLICTFVFSVILELLAVLFFVNAPVLLLLVLGLLLVSCVIYMRVLAKAGSMA